MRTFAPLVPALLLLVAFAAPTPAAPVKIGAYKGTVAVTQTLVESGATVKRTFPVSGRIRDNATFVLISAPIGISNTMFDGRYFTGTMNLQTALINFINGNDVDGTVVGGNNLQGSYSGNIFKLTFDSTVNLGGVLGTTTVKRVFTLRRVGP